MIKPYVVVSKRDGVNKIIDVRNCKAANWYQGPNCKHSRPKHFKHLCKRLFDIAV